MLRTVLDVPAVAALTADVSSFRRFWRPDGRPVRVRALGGHGIVIRPGTSDAKVLRETLGSRPHVPPVTAPEVIWDLGTNIGITVAHLAVLHPQARITGLELDPDNHRLAEQNLQPWSDRCRVIRAAAWTEDGVIRFASRPGHEAGAHVAEEGEEVPAMSLNSLLELTGPPDYVKMDIEGAEKRVLRENTQWAQRTRSMQVEVHGDYSVDDCRRDLEALGFVTEVAPVHWWPPARGRPSVVARRAG